MSSDAPTIRLDLESRPQTLTIVRGMLGGVAELLSADAELLDDLKTAVSEACNNVVLHAYGGEPGPMLVSLFVDAQRIRVTVTDEGAGISAAERSTDRADGIGLSVIRALADEVRFVDRREGGTEIQMEFLAHRAGGMMFEAPAAAGADQRWSRAAGGEVVLSLSPVTLLPGVLGRLARTLAATAHFSLDRFSDVYLVTDTLAAHAVTGAAGQRIGARMSAEERRLEIAVGPFSPGAAQLLSGPATGRAASPLALLSDSVTVEPDGQGELLRVVVVDHNRL